LLWTFGSQREARRRLYSNLRKTEVYKSSKVALREIRVPVESFLSGKDAFLFPVDEARSVELTVDGKTTTFSKTDTDWKMSGRDAGEFQGTTLADFFQKLMMTVPVADELPKDVSSAQ